MRVINRVRERREELKMTRERLAELVGVSVTTIRNIENPDLDVKTSLHTCYLLSVYLHYPLTKLFEFVGVITVPSEPTPNYPESVVSLANYLLDCYGDLGDPTTTEGLALYPECDAKAELTQLLQQLGAI